MNQAIYLDDTRRKVERSQSYTSIGIAIFAFLFERIILPCVRALTPSDSLPLEWQKLGDEDSFKLRSAAAQHYKNCALYRNNSRRPCLKCLEYIAGFSPVFDWQPVTLELIKSFLTATITAAFAIWGMVTALGMFCVAMWFVGPNLTPQQRRRLEAEKAQKERAQSEWEQERDQRESDRQQEQEQWERKRQDDWERQRDELDRERDNAQREWERQRDEFDKSRHYEQDEWERQRDENWERQRDQLELEKQLAQLEWERREFEYHRDRKAVNDLVHTEQDMRLSMHCADRNELDFTGIENEVLNEKWNSDQDITEAERAEKQSLRNADFAGELNSTTTYFSNDSDANYNDKFVREANYQADQAANARTFEEWEKSSMAHGKALEDVNNDRESRAYHSEEEAESRAYHSEEPEEEPEERPDKYGGVL